MPFSIDSDRRWVVVQLTSSAEREKNLKNIERAVHKTLRKILNVFIPASSQKAREDTQVIFFLDGYIFIEFAPGINYLKLNNTHFFEMVLNHNKTGYHLLKDVDLAPIWSGVENLKIVPFSIGDLVKVKKGSFKNLTGSISHISEDGEKIQINLKLASKPVLIEYPASYLEKV